MPPRAQFTPPTLAVAPPAPPFTPHALRYGLVPFERARDRPCPPLLRRETLILPSPHPDPSVASLRIPLLHHIYPLQTYPMRRRTRPAAGAGQVGWRVCGRPAWGRRGGSRLCWAAGGALSALEGHGPQPACIFVDSALPAHAVGCSVRVSCSANSELYEGMRVVCVWVRHFFTIGPPIIRSLAKW